MPCLPILTLTLFKVPVLACITQHILVELGGNLLMCQWKGWIDNIYGNRHSSLLFNQNASTLKFKISKIQVKLYSFIKFGIIAHVLLLTAHCTLLMS